MKMIHLTLFNGLSHHRIRDDKTVFCLMVVLERGVGDTSTNEPVRNKYLSPESPSERIVKITPPRGHNAVTTMAGNNIIIRSPGRIHPGNV